jgi:MtrB/PioB family decaheme-associated outer membrane protein
MKTKTKLRLIGVMGALVFGTGQMIPGALAADVMPTKAMPAAEPIPFWWVHGDVEVGGRFFLNHPSRNGVASAGENSLAKYYEYSTIKPGAFLNGYLSTGSSDGLYQVDLGAENIGYSDQSYYADLSKAGEHYLSLGWDQVPHVYSTSAKTLYNGVGSNALTLPTGLSAALFAASGNGNPINPVNAIAVRALIDANVHQTDIGIRRDTASVEYRYTPTTAWDIKANYSDMHRTGTQVDGITFGLDTSGVRVDAPKPVDDRTQSYGLGGEYAGTSPWGQKFNFKLAYNGSAYSEVNESYTIENPFCPLGAGANGCAQTGSTSSPLGLVSLTPDNQANSFSGTLGADLPFKSRYMGTVSYNMMRQNEQFQPFTLTPGLILSNGALANLLSSLPAQSLNGNINTLLVNNVVATQLTSDLKSKVSYRYYNYDNNTPEIYFKDGFIGADTTLTTYPNPRSLQASYTKQNVGTELNWHATRQLNLGASYGFERYDRTRADVTATNENTGKLYGDWKPVSWVTARASYLYSGRRFDGVYDNFNNVVVYMWGPTVTPTTNVVANADYRNPMYANRDRNLAKMSVSVDVAPKITVTPTAGLKYDDYLNKINLGSLTTTCGGPNCVYAGTYNGIPLKGTEPGLKSDTAWNLGAELSVVASPSTTFLFSYTREYGDKDIFWCGNATAGGNDGPIGGCSAFSANGATGTGAPSGSNEARMKDTVDTFIVRVKHDAIPNKLDLDFGYTLSIANSSTSLNPGPFASYSGGAVTVVAGPYPDTKTTFQRFDAIAKYKFDQDVFQWLGNKAGVSAKLRYAYERNRVTNWQNDPMQNYMYSSANNTLGYMIWLAGNNPNYDVHLIAASLNFKW